MNVAVVNTGTELLLGATVNTHAAYLGRELLPLGLRIAWQVTVPDGDAIRAALLESFKHGEVVFVTGGLGPTSDDLTREICAELLGVNLISNPRVRASIEERFARLGIRATERIWRQTNVPDGATVLPNSRGTAPGLYLPANINPIVHSPHLFLLPGPPNELKPMFRDSVIPILQRLRPASGAKTSRTFRTAGIGESLIEEAVGRQIEAIGGIELGYCAHPGTADIRIIGAPDSLDRAEGIIRRALADSIYGTGDDQLTAVVVRALADRNETLSIAESCTGGFLSHKITNVPGASAVFIAGYVTYANEAKIATLGIDPEALKTHGAVSEQVARDMAERALMCAKTTYALATTGVAGPGGGSDEKPVGTVFIALAAEGTETTVIRHRFSSDRETFKERVAQASFEMLRQLLRKR